MSPGHLLAYAAAVVLSFVWIEWKQSSSFRTKMLGVVAIVAVYLVYASLTR